MSTTAMQIRPKTTALHEIGLNVRETAEKKEDQSVISSSLFYLAQHNDDTFKTVAIFCSNLEKLRGVVTILTG